MRVLFTGGTGKAGRHVIPYLVSRGHSVVNLDLAPLRHPGVADIVADITDSGQVFNVLTSHARITENPLGPPPKFDAVVHFAAIAGLHQRSDNETFRINTVGTYNVIDTAARLGISKIIFASSECTYGMVYASGPVDPKMLPLDEESETVPMDSYGLSKVVNEITAKSIQRRSGFDIYGLRIGAVMQPEDYEQFPRFFADPGSRRMCAFSYADARDIAQIVDLALGKNGLGYQVFNACNDTNLVCQSNPELLERFFPGVPLSRPVGLHEGLLSNRKAREVLGFREEHNWRKYVADPTA